MMIEIKNWHKFNPRHDVKSSSWFRLEHAIMFSPEWDHFDGQEIAVYLYLLCHASFTKKHVFEIDTQDISRRARVNHEKVESALKKLDENQSISITSRARNAHVTDTLRTRIATDGRTDVTDVTDERTIVLEKSSTPIAEIRQEFMAAYKREFGREYPAWGLKENGMVKNWLKSISLETAKRLCGLYPKWNDPWVTKQGHPLGILVSQYVQLDAWASSSEQLIKKIASGKAAEANLMQRAISEETIRHGLDEKRRQRISNNENSERIFGQLQSEAERGIFTKSDDQLGYEI